MADAAGGVGAALALAAVLLGCGKDPPAPAAKVDSAAPPAASAAPRPTAEPTSTAAAAPGGAACAFDRGLTGTIGRAGVFVHLARTGDDLAGTYFYANVGADLSLKGTVRGTAITLDEAVAGKSTGTITGECQAGGAIAGTWTSPDRSRTLPVALAVPSRPMVGTRKLEIKAKSTVKVGGQSLGDCEYRRSLPVVFGGPSAAVERRMAESIARAAKGISDPAEEKAARACPVPGEDLLLSYFDGGFTVASQDRNLLVLQFSAAISYVPAAHPANFAGATVLNLDLATGDAVTAKDVLTDEKRVVALAQKCTDTEAVLAESEPAFLFLPHGIRVVGTSYPHVVAVWTFQGPELSYAALLRDGLLKPGAPIARVWASEKPAAAGESPCKTRWK